MIDMENKSTTPDKTTAGYWWTKLLTSQGILGMLLLPLGPSILLINSYILSLRFEILFDSPGIPLFTLNIMGWSREITSFDLFGALVSLCQMASAAAMVEGRKSIRFLFPKAVIAWLSLAIFEIILSICSGFLIDKTLWNAGLSALMALGITMVEAVSGIFIIDFFLIPLVLSILWSIASPIRALVRWVKAPHRKTQQIPKTVSPKEKGLSPLSYFFAGIDEVLFDPLRDLDEIVYDRVRDRLRGKSQTRQNENRLNGGDNNAKDNKM